MDRVSPALQLIVDHLPDCPALVFSLFGEVLLRTPRAVVLFGDVGVEILDRRFRTGVWCGGVLLDPVERQILLILTCDVSPVGPRALRELAACDGSKCFGTKHLGL